MLQAPALAPEAASLADWLPRGVAGRSGPARKSAFTCTQVTTALCWCHHQLTGELWRAVLTVTTGEIQLIIHTRLSLGRFAAPAAPPCT